LSNGKRLQKRKAKGMQTRAEYLESHSLSKNKPWEAEGMSRATWYRRQKGNETSLAAIHNSNRNAKPVSRVWQSTSIPWISEDGTSATQLSGTPELCLRLYAMGLLEAAPNPPPQTLAEIRSAMGYRQ
jgi:hypothetical protein